MNSTKIIIGGTACVGKSRYLSDKGKYFAFPIVHGDYFNHQKEYPMLEGLGDDPIKSILYLNLIMNKQKAGHIHDRGIIDIIVYQLIWNIRHEKYGLLEAERRLRSILKMLTFDDVVYIIIIWGGRLDRLMERMQKRNNGIDWMDCNYINYQDRLFSVVAQECKLKKIVASEAGDNWQTLHSWLDMLIIPILISRKAITSVRERKQYKHDAGLDMVAAEDCFLEPGKINKILLEGFYIIKPGYVGRICGRSSNVKIGIADAGGGVIDAGYKGKLKFACITFKGQMIKKGTPICQMVLHKIASPTKGCNEDTLNNYLSIRGEAGFGSTDAL